MCARIGEVNRLACSSPDSPPLTMCGAVSLVQEPYDDLGGRLNRQMIGAIYKKRVRCLHHALGCTAEMEIGYENRNILAHREVCTFEPITCERCHAQVPRLKVEQHDAEECPGRQKQTTNRSDR